LWNKLGATLAHLGRADEAIEAYHKALDLKPNYVRVWVNLGIAHSFKVFIFLFYYTLEYKIILIIKGRI